MVKYDSISGASVKSSVGEFVLEMNIFAASVLVIGMARRSFFRSEKKRFVDHVRTVVPAESSEKSEKVFPLAPKSLIN